LKVETQTLEDHQAKLIVELEPEMLEAAKHRAAYALAKKVRIPGFRPGKAPYAMIVRHLGEGEILEHAIELLVDDNYQKVIQEAGIKPYGPGSLEQIKSLDPLTLEFRVPLAAEVKLGDYKSIRLPYEPPQVSSDQVERILNMLRAQHAVLKSVDRPAQAGDQLQLRVRAVKIDPDDPNPTLYEDRTLNLVIEHEGEEIFQNLPFPGFTEHLIGASAGQTLTVRYKYPEDSPMEILRDEEVEFTIFVEQVNSRTLPESNDEFAQSIGEFATLEDLRREILSDLQERAEEEYNADYDDQVLDQLVEQSSVVYPPQMLEDEIEDVIRQLERRLQTQGLDLELYLKTRGITREQLVEEAKPVAEARLKRALVLFELAEKENIQVDPEELQDETIRKIEFYATVMNQKDFQRMVRKDNASSIVTSVMMDMMIDKTQERLRNYARGISPEPEAEAVQETETESVTESPQETPESEHNNV